MVLLGGKFHYIQMASAKFPCLYPPVTMPRRNDWPAHNISDINLGRPIIVGATSERYGN